jgi:hypothetical protein
MAMEMICFMVVLFFILYMATTAVTQNEKYFFSFFVLVFWAADLNLHDPELSFLLFIALGAISLVKLIIDIAFTSMKKNLIACFFFSLGLFTITNLLMIKEKVALWVDIGSPLLSIVILFWILNLFDLIQIRYISHFFFVHFIQKRKENKRKKDQKDKKKE